MASKKKPAKPAPSKPTKPAPAKPAKPAKATKPSAPTKPSTPAKPAPAKPNTPAKPAPAKPAKPAKPAPAKPTQPTTPTFVLEDVPFRLLLLQPTGVVTLDKPVELAPGGLFAVEPRAATSLRYQYLLQMNDEERIVLLAVHDGAAPTRVPPAPHWQRAIVPGQVYLLASDTLLDRADIAAIRCPHEPAIPPAKPPYT